MKFSTIDVDNDFKPIYVVTPDKKQQVTKLKRLLKDVDELYLATDEDREGEAIAWHLIETLMPRRREGFSIACTGTRCLRCCGARSSGDCRPAACNRRLPA